MKKIFSIQVPNKKPARQVDAIKHEVKKYIARERRRDLPEGADFWDFDCAIGVDQENAEKIHLKEINAKIDRLFEDGKQEFFLQVMAQPRARKSKKN